MEEQVKTVPFLGIKRNASIAQVEDGACDEIINLRFKEGSWRPVMDKVLLATLPDYDKVYKHNVEHTYDVWIGYNEEVGSPGGASGSIYSNINSVETLLFGIPFSEAFVSFSHIDNYVIVLTDLNKYILFWNGSEYVLLPDIPNIPFYAIDNSTGETDLSDDSYGGVYAKYLELAQKFKESGKYEGHILLIAAYKLFDGTYIKHSNPVYVQPGIIESESLPLHFGKDGDNYEIKDIRFGNVKIELQFSSQEIDDIKLYEGVIESICIFSTYPISAYYGVDSITDTLLEYYKVTNVEDLLNQSITYYRIHNIPIKSVSSDLLEIDFPSPVDFIANPTLAIDQFTNHKLINSIINVYNSRQHLGNVKTILQPGHNPFISVDNETYLNHYCLASGTGLSTTGTSPPTMKMFVWIATDHGIKIVEHDLDVQSYKDDSGYEFVIMKPFITYPDNRANKVAIYVKDTASSNWTKWLEEDLESHQIHNLSFKVNQYSYNNPGNWYAKTSVFISKIFDLPIYSTTDELPTEDIYISEPNRLQLSGINNPFYLPTINSYKIGNFDDQIFGIQPSVAPISENQVGQHPVFIFTKEAIYAMVLGSGEVVYSAMIPVVNEDFDSSSIFIPVKNGVVFTCDRGLKYIEGRQVLNIDNFIRERPDQNLITDTYFINIVTAPTIGNTITELQPYLSTVPFLDYLSGAKLAFDNEEEELIVSNSTYAYSYVYNFKTNSWHKISSVYSEFINLFPKYGGVILDGSYDKIYDISDESSSVNTESIIITRPVKLSGEGYKKISGGLLRCNILDYTLQNKHQAFYIYGSVDGNVWKYLSGKQLINSDDNFNIGVNKHHVSCKYYIFVFAGHFYYKNTISLLELTFADVARNKLR